MALVLELHVKHVPLLAFLAFAAQDEKWPSYFLAEPGLNVGFTF
jgi:hypothetical protein